MKVDLLHVAEFAHRRQDFRVAVRLDVPVEHSPRRTGMASPRKRPRRLFKKLAARGFAAHYGGQAFSQVEIHTSVLRPDRLPYSGPCNGHELRVSCAALLLLAPPKPDFIYRGPHLKPGSQPDLRLAPAYWYPCARYDVPNLERISVRSPCAFGDRPSPAPASRTTYLCRLYSSGYMDSTLNRGDLTVTVSLVVPVYAVEGADVEAALEPRVQAVLYACQRALHDPMWVRVTRQTCYSRRG